MRGVALPPGKSAPEAMGDRRRWGRKPRTGATTRGVAASTPLFAPRAYLRFRGGDNANKRNSRSAGTVRTGSSIPSSRFRFFFFFHIVMLLRFKTVVVVVAAVATLSFYQSFFFTNLSQGAISFLRAERYTKALSRLCFTYIGTRIALDGCTHYNIIWKRN